jgi:hypothetical protein
MIQFKYQNQEILKFDQGFIGQFQVVYEFDSSVSTDIIPFFRSDFIICNLVFKPEAIVFSTSFPTPRFFICSCQEIAFSCKIHPTFDCLYESENRELTRLLNYVNA